MNKNPWTRERIQSYIDFGAEEGYQLEFKSSLGLLEKPDKFYNDLSADISAFINSDGGLLIIGIEEAPRRDEKQAGKATSLSTGVPRSKCSKDKLSSAVCDRIHPSVASYVQVYPIVVSKEGGEDLLAFVIDITPGITAYQAADKRYYARRSSGNDPMEDKDVRLRMMADDRPRGRVGIEYEWAPRDRSIAQYQADSEPFRLQYSKCIGERGGLDALTAADFSECFPLSVPKDLRITIRLMLDNVGSVTIREGAVSASLQLDEMGSVNIVRQLNLLERFSFIARGDSMPALYPEMAHCVAEWSVDVLDCWEMNEGRIRLTNVSVYLDNGAPAARSMEFDLSGAFWDTVTQGRDELSRIAKGNSDTN